MGKRIISRRRGAGTGPYRSPSHRHHGPVRLPDPKVRGEATILSIQHAPGRNAPVAIVSAPGGGELRLVAPAGAATGDVLALGEGRLARGSILRLSEIPDGTLVSNIEVQPNDGGKLVRSAGTAALVVGHQGREVTLELPSGRFKNVLIECRAQVGVVAGGGRSERPFIKAGKKVLAYASMSKPAFKVRGVAMNPVNHPFGGGAHQHVGRPSTVSSGTWPGAKVGRFGPRRTRGRQKRRAGAR